MHVKYMRKRDREMKITRMQKLLATILAVALSLTMLPAQVMAAELSSTDQREQNTLQADPRLMQGESGAATITDSDKDVDAEILGEIPSGRDEYQKEFLLSNGQRLLVLYPTPVHYEENGQWEEIDNTLLPVSEDEISVYQNTAGPWDVTFPAKLIIRNLFLSSRTVTVFRFALMGVWSVQRVLHSTPRMKMILK